MCAFSLAILNESFVVYNEELERLKLNNPLWALVYMRSLILKIILGMENLLPCLFNQLFRDISIYKTFAFFHPLVISM